jgi:hypothetical protein
MFLASLAALMAPVLLALSHLFTMNAFDPLLWTGIAYLLVRIARAEASTLWLVVGALTGITILNKYAILFWLAGVVIGICLTGFVPACVTAGSGWAALLDHGHRGA